MNRLRHHYPVPAANKTADGIDQQRIYDQRIMQDNISSVIDEIADKPQLDSVLLEDIALGTGSETLVEHKLNREIRGWKITSISANATVWDSIRSTNVDLTKYLPLTASASVIVSLEVF